MEDAAEVGHPKTAHIYLLHPSLWLTTLWSLTLIVTWGEAWTFTPAGGKAPGGPLRLESFLVGVPALLPPRPFLLLLSNQGEIASLWVIMITTSVYWLMTLIWSCFARYMYPVIGTFHACKEFSSSPFYKWENQDVKFCSLPKVPMD
jgi:hypothetical protein